MTQPQKTDACPAFYGTGSLAYDPGFIPINRSFSENRSAATQPMRYHFGLLLEHSRRR